MTGLGYDWAVRQTVKALGELVELLGQSTDDKLAFSAPRPKPSVRITCASADSLPLEDASVDCVVMDPPYYDNVMYAELVGLLLRLAQTHGGAAVSGVVHRPPDRQGSRSGRQCRQVRRAEGRRKEPRRPRLPAPHGRHLQGAAARSEAGRHHDRDVHAQSGRGVGRTGRRLDRGRLYDHGVLAHQHRGRRAACTSARNPQRAPPSSWSAACARPILPRANPATGKRWSPPSAKPSASK